MGNSYRFKIGDFQCLALNDGNFIGNAEMLFTNAPQEKLLQVLQNYDLNADHLPSTWTCLLVKTPTNVVLVDTGLGTGGEYGGQLLPLLHEEGFQPQDIDTVILTHAHGDHIGGCVDKIGRATFPEATYYMWQDEWDFWTTETTLQKAPEWAANLARQKLPPLANQLKTVDSETEIVTGIRAVAAPGHTVGHMAVEVESGGEYLLAIIDVALHPIQIEHPEWYAQLDQIPEQTIATRQTIYQRAAEKKALVLAFHFPPFPSLGYISKQEGRWKWQTL